MRKIIIAVALSILLSLFCGCAKKVNYLDYISEKRSDIYLYSNDGFEIKIYKSLKETPYATDGIKSEMSELTEIFVKLTKNYDEVNISVGNAEGEMSYRAVENEYYLSLSDGGISGDSVEVTLTFGGESSTYTATSVTYQGLISCEDAVLCVVEHNADLFKSLTENRIFSGEIYVRLLYDDGCFYYVGVCDRNKKISAFLVDGEDGKIIANRQLNG